MNCGNMIARSVKHRGRYLVLKSMEGSQVEFVFAFRYQKPVLYDQGGQQNSDMYQYPDRVFDSENKCCIGKLTSWLTADLLAIIQHHCQCSNISCLPITFTVSEACKIEQTLLPTLQCICNCISHPWFGHPDASRPQVTRYFLQYFHFRWRRSSEVLAVRWLDARWK